MDMGVWYPLHFHWKTIFAGVYIAYQNHIYRYE